MTTSKSTILPLIALSSAGTCHIGSVRRSITMRLPNPGEPLGVTEPGPEGVNEVPASAVNFSNIYAAADAGSFTRHLEVLFKSSQMTTTKLSKQTDKLETANPWSIFLR